MRLIDADALMQNIPSEEIIAKMAVAHALTIERKRGEWIYVTVEEWLRTGRDYGHHCSECDEINESGKSNFCPNCGADMRGGNNE